MIDKLKELIYCKGDLLQLVGYATVLLVVVYLLVVR